MAAECVKAASVLSRENIDAEVIDLRSLKPWDSEAVLESTRKTGHAIVTDPGWRTAGAAADIAATISEQVFHDLKQPVTRVTLPDCPAPTSRLEESAYYPGAKEICAAARKMLGLEERLRLPLARLNACAEPNLEPRGPGR
jgi:pyruvate dehydrogenase E1 component beta subunit